MPLLGLADGRGRGAGRLAAPHVPKHSELRPGSWRTVRHPFDVCSRRAGGGPIHVTNMDCRGGVAALRSGGGRVSVDSLDGNLSIHSDGGNVQVGGQKG